MYNIYIPTVVTAEAYNRENILSELKRAGASRVYLAIGASEYGSNTNRDNLEILRRDIPFYKDNGLEVGVWFWSTMLMGDSPFTHITDFDGNTVKNHICPSDEGFIEFTQSLLREIAKLSPDLIMFDDDMRFGNLSSAFGCCCENHLNMMSDMLGEKIEREGIYKKMFSGKPNKLRSAFLRSCGASLENFCRKMREAVNSVNKDIRLGLCACISNYDLDGTNAFTMSKILAGDTKPFLRLIGAPYWGARNCWSHRLPDVIEFERAQRSWYDGNDIEIFLEGDVYPRPRYKVPSSYLEIFDSALRASGGFDGILKYMLDYTSTTAYEREYVNRHVANTALHQYTERLFNNKASTGIRIYESMKKIEDADFTHRKHTVGTISDIPFSRAFRLAAENSLPTTYKGTGICGLCLGENIRSIVNRKECFSKPMIIDLPAARILYENGIDVGILAFEGQVSSACEHFLNCDEYVKEEGGNVIEKVSLNKDAEILSTYIIDSKQEIPASFKYTNKKGMRFLVYTFDGQLSDSGTIRNYMRQKQITEVLAEYGEILPAYISGCPDLYMIVKKDDEGNTAIGLWNCFPDGIYNREIVLDRNYGNCDIVNFAGEHLGNRIRIDKLGASEFGFIDLKI